LQAFAAPQQAILSLRERGREALVQALREHLTLGWEALAEAYRWTFDMYLVMAGLGQNVALCTSLTQIKPTAVICLSSEGWAYPILRDLARDLDFTLKTPARLPTRLALRRWRRQLLGKGRDWLEWWRIARAKMARRHLAINTGAVLACAWYHNHFNTLAPVVAELQRREVPASLVLGTAFAARKDPSPHDALSYQLLEAQGPLWPSSFLRQPLKVVWFETVLAKPFETTEPGKPLVGMKWLARDLAFRFSDSLQHTARFHAAAQRIIGQRPRAILLPYQDSQYVRILTSLARQQGIPVIEILQAIPSRNTNDYFVGAGDYLVVWGEYTRRVLCDIGAPPDRVVPLGSPLWDVALRNHASQQQAQAGAVIPLPQITYLTIPVSNLSMSREQKREVMSWLREVLLRFPDLRLLIKLHPVDARGIVERAALGESNWKELADRVEIIDHGPIEPVLERSGLILSPFSTAIFEALLMGKPLVYLPLWGTDVALEQVLKGASQVVRAQTDLLQTVEQYLRQGREAISPSQRVSEVLEDVFFRLDGRAAERCADFVVSVLDSAKGSERK